MSDPASMTLTLRRSGGLAGLVMEASLAGEELSADEAAAVVAGVQRAARAGAAAALESPGGADRFQYTLIVTRGDERHELTFSEPAVPEALVAVVRRMEARARPAG